MHDLNGKRSLFGTNFNLERSLSAIDGSPCLKNLEKTEDCLPSILRTACLDGKNTMSSPCETKCNPPRYSAMSSRKRPLRLQNELPKASASPTQQTPDTRGAFPVPQGAATDAAGRGHSASQDSISVRASETLDGTWKRLSSSPSDSVRSASRTKSLLNQRASSSSSSWTFASLIPMKLFPPSNERNSLRKENVENKEAEKNR